MNYESIIIPSRDLYSLDVRIYESASPTCIVQIIHGMEEHQGRYEKFAEYLVSKNITVVTSDLRGHGKSAPKLSHIADKDGDKLLIEDEQVISEYIKNRFPNIPIILFAHSMGSIICRVLLQKDSQKYSKVILSGFPNYNPATNVAIGLANVIKLFKGSDGHSSLLTGAALGSFAKAIENRKTDLDWLSFNEENVKKYSDDPLCGEEFTVGSYHTLFKLVKKMHQSKAYKSVNKDLPILMVYGSDDPCVGGDKGKDDSVNTLKKAGFNNINVKCFEKMRHEILNEDDYQTVFETIYSFIK